MATSTTASTTVSSIAEPLLRDRVVGGLVVRSDADAARERGRHRVAMRAHVRDLPRGEPEADAERRDERDGECEVNSDEAVMRDAAATA